MNQSNNLPDYTDTQESILSIQFLLFGASFAPAFVAGGISYYFLDFHWFEFLLIVLALLAVQAGGNFLYYFFSNRKYTALAMNAPSTAGTKPLFAFVNFKSKFNLLAGIIFLAIDLLIAYFFFLKLGWMIPVLAATAMLLAIFFSVIARKGFREPIIFLAFGPFAVVGAVYALTGQFLVSGLVASLPLGFLATVIAYLMSAKLSANNENQAVLLPKSDKNVIIQLIILAYLTLTVNALLDFMPLYTIAGIVSLPLSLSVVKVVRNSASGKNDYLWAMVKAIFALIISAALIAVAYILQT